MRIALVHYSAPPVVGGVESIMAAQASLFASKGHDVRTIARRGEVTHRLRSKDPAAELAAAVADTDLVIAHNVMTMPFDIPLTEALWGLAHRHLKTRWVTWVHDIAASNPDYDHPWHQSPWDVLTRPCPGFTYVAVSDQRARQIESLMRTHVTVIPNGIDPEETLAIPAAVRPFARTHRLLDRDIVLLHPTRLLRRKNVEFGLNVIAQLRRRGRNAVTLITGAADPHNGRSAEYAQALLAHRDALELQDAAFFVGDHFPVAPLELSGLYTLADALLFPSRQEGFGLPVLEAALHRLPIFCADIEPMNSLLSHSLHVFDPSGSAQEVATLIERTLDRSAPHRARRETIRKYAWGAVWQNHLAPFLYASGHTTSTARVR